MSDERSADHDPGALDDFGEHVDPAMVVVTTTNGVERAGCLVGFHVQSSIDPDRYAVWLSKANRTFRVAVFADHLAVHLLGHDDHDLAELFGSSTGDDIDKFARCAWTPGTGGVPLLDRLPNRFVGRRVSWSDDADSDHVCVVLAPELVETAHPFTALRLSALTDLTAGHDAGDRPPPDGVGEAR